MSELNIKTGEWLEIRKKDENIVFGYLLKNRKKYIEISQTDFRKSVLCTFLKIRKKDIDVVVID